MKYWDTLRSFCNKSSAVAEIGDRLATVDVGQKGRLLCPFAGGGSWAPSNTMWPRPRSTSLPSGILIHPSVWPQQTWAENSMGLCPFGGGVCPHLRQCGQGRGLPPYQVASSSIQPFGHNRHRPKIGGLPFPFLGGGSLVPHVTSVTWSEAYPRSKWHLDPCSRLATIHGRKLGGAVHLFGGE